MKRRQTQHQAVQKRCCNRNRQSITFRTLPTPEKAPRHVAVDVHVLLILDAERLVVVGAGAAEHRQHDGEVVFGVHEGDVQHGTCVNEAVDGCGVVCSCTFSNLVTGCLGVTWMG